MLLNLLKGKIHCAAVTEANLHYMGSITIDEALMEAAGILPNERVQVVDNNNGERFETYIIKGEDTAHTPMEITVESCAKKATITAIKPLQ